MVATVLASTRLIRATPHYFTNILRQLDVSQLYQKFLQRISDFLLSSALWKPNANMALP